MAVDSHHPGGYGPRTRVQGLLAMSQDAPSEDLVCPAAAAGMVPRSIDGTPLSVTFGNWNDGDVLDVSYDVTPVVDAGTDETEPAESVAFLPLVSLDGGQTFDALSPGQSALRLHGGDGEVSGSARASVAIAVPGTVPPIVCLAYVADGDFALGAAGSLAVLGSASLTARRLSPDVIDQGPTGVLLALE